MRPVLLVAYHYPPEGGSSGVLRALKFSKYLPAYGWTPHVLTLRPSFYEARDDRLSGDIPPEAVIHRTLGFDTARHLAIRGRYWGALAVPDRFVSWIPFATARGLRVIARERIEAIFSTSPPATAHLIALMLHRWTGRPWIADFRDPWIEEGIHPPPGTRRDRVERMLERRVVRGADRIVATTPRLAEEIRTRHRDLDPASVRVIFNGFDGLDFEHAAAPPRRDRFELLHAGLVTPDFRDPTPVLEAVAGLLREGRLPGDRFRIVFLGGGEYLNSEAFRSTVNRLGLASIVEVAGRVSHDEAIRRQRAAGALLLLQASEDTRQLIPAKAFEYLRTDRPVLVLTLEGDTADLFRGMVSCRVHPPEDRAGLSDAILGFFHAWERDPAGIGIGRPIERYERRALTGELAALLDEVTPSRVGHKRRTHA